MFRKLLPISVFALSALFSVSFAQDAYKELDIVFRDFPTGHYGFEMFDIDWGRDGVCAKPEGSSINVPSNRVCFSGDTYMPCDKGGQTLKYGQDDCNDNVGWRGYCNGPDKDPRFGNKNCPGDGGETICWANEVWITRGMVEDRLDYSRCSDEERKGDTDIEKAINGRYCARPQATSDAKCYGRSKDGRNDNVAEWFTDGGKAKRIEGLMRLNHVNSGIYEIRHDYNIKKNWNGDGDDNGYFPLDEFPDDQTWGKQDVNVWCPYNNGNFSNAEPYWPGENCSRLRSNGWESRWDYRNNDDGRANAAAARTTANSIGWNKLHNYGYTMAGSGVFKYVENSSDVFEFIGDDDMWIFIDGELAIDLGGTHLAAPGKIKIADYGRDKRWEPNSMHVINFYYADRQTDASSMRLRMSLSDLMPPRFGGPYITEAKTILEEGQQYAKTQIWVSTEIDINSLKRIMEFGEYPIIVTKGKGEEATEVLGYKIIEIIDGPKDGGAKGYVYTIIGEACDKNGKCGVLASGDHLTFNVEKGNLEDSYGSTGSQFGLPNGQDMFIKSKNGTAADKIIRWAKNTTDLPPIDFKPDVADENPAKPIFVIPEGPGAISQTPPGGSDPTVPGNAGGSVGNVGMPAGQIPNISTVWDPTADGGNGGMVSINSVPGASTDNNVHGFGTVGNQIPVQRAGELILTAFPSNADAQAYKAWQESPDYKYFGLPPKSAGAAKGTVDAFGNPAWWGEADPTVEAFGGGYTFVKNGFPNESNAKGQIKVSPTRCTMEIVNDEPRINCLNFSLLAKQPFKLSVIIYDQLGNFVTQYREVVTEQEFRNVIQASAFLNGNQGTAIGPNEDCLAPDGSNYGAPTTLSMNGYVNVNVNIYPFSSTGRRFGNGVYIAKIDRVDLPFEDGVCVSNSGNAQKISPSFVRFYADQRFGWMRSAPEKK